MKAVSATCIAVSIIFSSVIHTAFAGNDRICTPKVANTDVHVKFPNGGFAMAGDYGSDRIITRYDSDNGQGVLITGRYTNAMGGGSTAPNTLCYIDQAKDVGVPATLIMVFGD